MRSPPSPALPPPRVGSAPPVPPGVVPSTQCVRPPIAVGGVWKHGTTMREKVGAVHRKLGWEQRKPVVDTVMQLAEGESSFLVAPTGSGKNAVAPLLVWGTGKPVVLFVPFVFLAGDFARDTASIFQLRTLRFDGSQASAKQRDTSLKTVRDVGAGTIEPNFDLVLVSPESFYKDAALQLALMACDRRKIFAAFGFDEIDVLIKSVFRSCFPVLAESLGKSLLYAPWFGTTATASARTSRLLCERFKFTYINASSPMRTNIKLQTHLISRTSAVNVARLAVHLFLPSGTPPCRAVPCLGGQRTHLYTHPPPSFPSPLLFI